MNLAIVCPPILEGKSTLNSTGCSEPSGGTEKDLSGYILGDLLRNWYYIVHVQS